MGIDDPQTKEMKKEMKRVVRKELASFFADGAHVTIVVISDEFINALKDSFKGAIPVKTVMFVVLAIGVMLGDTTIIEMVMKFLIDVAQ
jgi:acid stress-induced BolA-like protein IbaG/YrbA